MKTKDNSKLAFVDIETTGLDRHKHEIIEIGLLIVNPENFEILETWHKRIKPYNLRGADPVALRINHFDPKIWEKASEPRAALEEFSRKTRDSYLVSHNISFDRPFLEDHFRRWQIPVRWHYHSLDTISFAYCKLQDLESLKLSRLAERLGIVQEKEHAALDDVMTCYRVFRKLVEEN
ncbi:MAG TPA: 3'-5' exonuclease [Patescibacteria group bacterium]|nr:3'-5' exonuclease [Patescibacteria group bacterium]